MQSDLESIKEEFEEKGNFFCFSKDEIGNLVKAYHDEIGKFFYAFVENVNEIEQLLSIKFVSNSEKREVYASKVLRAKKFDSKKIRLKENCGFVDVESGYEKFGEIKKIEENQITIQEIETQK